MNNPTRYIDPSGYKLYQKNTIWYAEGYLRLMGYVGNRVANERGIFDWYSAYSKATIGGYVGGASEFINQFEKQVDNSTGTMTFRYSINHFVGKSHFENGNYVLPELIPVGYSIEIKIGRNSNNAGDKSGNSFTENITNGVGVGLAAISLSVGRAKENELAYLNTTSLIKPTQTMLKVGPANLLVSNTLSTTLTRAGFGLSLLSANITIADGYNNGWENHHSADLIFNSALNGLSIVCPLAGLVVGGLYFVGDVTSQYYTGKSLTQNLFDQ